MIVSSASFSVVLSSAASATASGISRGSLGTGAGAAGRSVLPSDGHSCLPRDGHSSLDCWRVSWNII